MESHIQLKRKKRIALACLGVAAALFLCMAFLPQSFWWVRLLKAGAEAALVGGMADWFAVVALFRHPLGLPIPHTAIVPRSKDRIADSLSTFVKEKFLAPDLLVALIKKSNPVWLGAKWLAKPENAKRVAEYAGSLMRYGLEKLGEERIQAFIKDTVQVAVGKIDLSQSIGAILDMLTKGGRHQELLDVVLTHVQKQIGEPAIREEIVSRVARWYRSEYPTLETFVPDSAVKRVGEKAASAMEAGLKDFLQEVADNPTHELRSKVDDAFEKLIAHLRGDEDFIRMGEEIKYAFLNNPVFHEYIMGLWGQLRAWLMNDLNSSQPSVLENLSGIGLWIGQRLMQDAELRDFINSEMQKGAVRFAPRFADFLTGHIRKTTRMWDARQLSDQVELSIGADLQFIRINGTGVGFIIGILIFLVTTTIQNLIF